MTLELTISQNQTAISESCNNVAEIQANIQFLNIIKGKKGDKGDTPYIGLNGNWWVSGEDTGTPATGDDGVGISYIEKTGTILNVDEYTITFTDASTFLFYVTNGTDGRGIVSIIKTSTVGLVDTYTITYSDSTTSTFDVTNGEKGDDGKSAYQSAVDGGYTGTESDFNVLFNSIDEHITDDSIHHTIDDLDVLYEPKNSNIQEHIADTDIHVTTTDKSNWDAKADLNDVLKLDQSTPQTIVGRQIQQDGVQLGLTPTVGAHETGKMFWDADFKTPACELEDAVTLQIGQETVVYVYNGTGSILNQGDVVYSATTFNGVPSVALAKGDMDETSQVLGIITSTTILTGFYGYATIRGHVNKLDTSLFSVNDNLYLSAETAGKLTNVKPNTGDYDTRVARVMIQNATTGRVYVNIIREYKVGGISAGSGVDMYLDDTTITPSGTLSTYPIKTLSKTPIATTEDVDSIVLNNNTVMYGVYLNTAPIGKTSIAGGTWSFDIWAGVSSATNTTSLYQLVQRVRPEAGTITTTNLTATSKTVTASTGTPFATTKIDVGGTLLTCSFLRTPSGLYRILTRVSDTVITIEVPTTYVNESTVVYSVFKTLFSVNTGEINNVATSPLFAGLQAYYVTTVQGAFTVETTDTLATAMVGTSTGSRTVYFSHNGNNRYTHFHTPLSTSHNDLSGLNDGDYKHLTATQLSELTSVGSTYLKLDQTTPQTIQGNVNINGNLNAVTTNVNQSTLPSVNASQDAAILQDGSSFTGTDYVMPTNNVAVKFVASAAHTMGDFTVWVKSSATLTSTTATLRGYLYSDNAGSPSTLLAAGNEVRHGSITTSYQELSLGTLYNLVAGTTYWLVIRWSSSPTGGNIILGSNTDTNVGASSPDATTWTLTNVRLRYRLRGRTFYGINAFSTNSYGVAGTSTNSFGVYGNSTNSVGVYGNSTNGFGVYGNSTNGFGVQGVSTSNIGVAGISTNNYGVYGNSTNSVGVFGRSTNLYGVYGTSTNSFGVYGNSSNNRAGYFARNTATPTNSVPVVEIIQDHASDPNSVLDVKQDGTGEIARFFDSGNEVASVEKGGLGVYKKGVVIGDNTDVASYENRGATRYRENAGGSFYEMVMKKQDGSYAWTTIVSYQ